MNFLKLETPTLTWFFADQTLLHHAMIQWACMADWLSSTSTWICITSLCSHSVVNTLSCCCRTLRTKLFSSSLNLLAWALVTGPIGTWIGSRTLHAVLMSSSTNACNCRFGMVCYWTSSVTFSPWFCDVFRTYKNRNRYLTSTPSSVSLGNINSLKSTRVLLNSIRLSPSDTLTLSAFFPSYSSLCSFKTNQIMIRRTQVAILDKKSITDCKTN